MSMLKRIRTILASNIYEKLESVKDPEKEINQTIREMERDLREYKAETDAAIINMKRIKRELNDCRSEMNKLERYAKRSLENGDEDRARRFLEDKQNLQPKYEEYERKYELASIQVEQMKLAQDKLSHDVDELTNQRDVIIGKLRVTKSKREKTEMGLSGSNVRLTRFDELEEKANRLLLEAEALEELRNGLDHDMDELDRP